MFVHSAFAQRNWPRFAIFVFLMMAVLATASAPWALVRERPMGLSFVIAAAWLTIVGSGAFAVFKANRAVLITVIAAGAIVPRVALLVLSNGSLPTSSDSFAYMAFAASIAGGGGLQLNLGHLGLVHAVFPPLYPLLLAPFVALFGNNATAPIVLNLILDASTALGIYRLVRSLTKDHLDDRYALLAAFLFLVWPSILIGAIWAQKESLVCLLFVTFARLALNMRDHGPSKSTATFMGANAALIALTQPSLSLVPAALFLVSVATFDVKQFVRLGLVFGFTGAAVMLPWWIRNYYIFHAFVPLTSGNGFSLRMLTQGTWPLPAEVLSRSELERADYALGQALNVIINDPVRYIIQQMKNFIINLTVDVPMPATFDLLASPLSFDRRAFSLTFQIAPVLLWISAASAALFGRGDRNVRFIATLIVVSLLLMTAANSMLEFAPRHRVFLVPFVWVIAGILLSHRRSQQVATNSTRHKV